MQDIGGDMAGAPYNDMFRQLVATGDCACTQDELDRLDRLLNDICS